MSNENKTQKLAQRRRFCNVLVAKKTLVEDKKVIILPEKRFPKLRILGDF